MLGFKVAISKQAPRGKSGQSSKSHRIHPILTDNHLLHSITIKQENRQAPDRFRRPPQKVTIQHFSKKVSVPILTKGTDIKVYGKKLIILVGTDLVIHLIDPFSQCP
jgi:hypothetical protein